MLIFLSSEVRSHNSFFYSAISVLGEFQPLFSIIDIKSAAFALALSNSPGFPAGSQILGGTTETMVTFMKVGKLRLHMLRHLGVRRFCPLEIRNLLTIP